MRKQDNARPPQHQGPTQEQQKDMRTIHALLLENKKIRRSVKILPQGVEAITESDDPEVAAMIYEHTMAMAARLKEKRPIRQWDPLFALLFEQAHKIKLEVLKTKKGVRIRETSSDPYLVKAIQAHAEGVTDFVKEGTMGMAKEHPVPGKMGAARSSKPLKFQGKGDGIATCPVTGAPIDRSVKATIHGRVIYFCCPSCKDRTPKEPDRFLRR